LLASWFELTDDLNIVTVAEGMEAAGEADACQEIDSRCRAVLFMARQRPPIGEDRPIEALLGIKIAPLA
jgi:hypothetical protein